MKATVAFIALTSLLLLVLVNAAPPKLTVRVQTNGQYVIHLGNEIWLESGGTGFRSGNTWYASVDAEIKGAHSLLQVTGYSSVSGTDKLGAWTGTQIKWTASRNSSLTMFTTFKQYQDINAVGFVQYFPEGLHTVTVEDNHDVSTSFPSFKRQSYGSPKNYLTYYTTFAEYHMGHWDDDSTFVGGVEGGLPFILYDGHNNGIVISPIDNFMISSQTVTGSLASTLACGLSALVSSLPAGFSHQTILYAGDSGVSEIAYNWGSLLLHYHDKERTRLDADLFIQYLSYYTDNGAYYYYKTAPAHNYAQTISLINNYTVASKLPFKLFQFDSWWYYQEAGTGALLLWEPRPEIFPTGMRDVYESIGRKPLTLHNRYFSDKNDYLSKGFNFIVEEKAKMALPIDINLFKYIMSLARDWGMVVYEQDWLVTTYLTMQATRTSVTASDEWLMAMGEAAQQLGITVQYCMPLPNHILQSTKIQSVTQIRANGDYQPGNINWRLSYKSILHHAVGAIPFKDDFWTSNYEETGCNYRSCIEPNPDLVTLTALLSTGPVGPSDKIGFLNASRILPTVRADGLLLKPDRPPMPMNKVFTSTINKLPDGDLEVWDTYSTLTDNGWAWHYIVAADTQASGFSFTLDDLFGNFSRAGARSALVWNWHDYYNNNRTTRPSVVTLGQKLTIPQLVRNKNYEGHIPFVYWIIAPTFGNGWTFLGEMNRYATVSRQRFTDISIGNGGANGGYVDVKFSGSVGEMVNLAFSTPSRSLITLTCKLALFDGGAYCSGTSCSCY